VSVFVLIGILLGAVVTPETLRGDRDLALSIALLAMCAALMTVAATSYLRFVHGWEHCRPARSEPGLARGRHGFGDRAWGRYARHRDRPDRYACC